MVELQGVNEMLFSKKLCLMLGWLQKGLGFTISQTSSHPLHTLAPPHPPTPRPDHLNIAP